MQCVYWDDRLPDGFEEHVSFSAQMPYTIRIKQFSMEDIVPMHYAETMEILLCEDLCGEILIDNQHFSLGQRELFIIPPYTVHANNVRPGDGTMYVFKICFQELERYFQVESYLALRNGSVRQIKYHCEDYAAVKAIVERLIDRDGDLVECLPELVELFRLLSRHMNRPPVSDTGFKASSLQELIRWTHENYHRKIELEEVARLAGYSKYHFCSRFKAQTGTTYMRYLNSVRVSQACLLLRNGESVQSVCRSCGFENTSHFIQTFKQIRHMTPHQYAVEQKKHAP